MRRPREDHAEAAAENAQKGRQTQAKVTGVGGEAEEAARRRAPALAVDWCGIAEEARWHGAGQRDAHHSSTRLLWTDAIFVVSSPSWQPTVENVRTDGVVMGRWRCALEDK